MGRHQSCPGPSHRDHGLFRIRSDNSALASPTWSDHPKEPIIKGRSDGDASLYLSKLGIAGTDYLMFSSTDKLAYKPKRSKSTNVPNWRGDATIGACKKLQGHQNRELPKNNTNIQISTVES
ncbi:hypothetical protein BG015_005437 [Linnemannia schmuckeri]|uniref:Uncharacterized protein n=1 Tax=Linnemannia schmuckeri TaxID=64567 RepID=A0A9P5R4P5_9FUNG|nr:hypothetical protein BG015_005437 [Linnemannia schmuckeri]